MKKDTEITFSSEDKEILKKYEQKFKTALEGDYIRGVQKSDSRVLHEMLKKYNANVSDVSNLGCSSCILKLWKRVAKIYNNS